MARLEKILNRRRLLLFGIASGLSLEGVTAAPQPAAPAHAPFGPVVPPQTALSVPLIGDDGQAFYLPHRLRSKVTAVQLMFAGCSAICPIQGALFAGVAQRIESVRGAQLLSLTIDPLNDDPAALRRWKERFGAHRLWSAAAPKLQDVDALFDFLGGRNRGVDGHTGQVYLFDRQARLRYRTPEFPTISYVADIMNQLAQL
ncbi:SCO family protein [Methylibium sp. Root1272]|uniref:SCO family protein n=1 Tax=Methylibium sp. Root1272 TaxID=1736441 RepID=UPI0006F400CD|nr:SCO family protein [Methylibium sp. Root1272]KQW66878.1 hypothetical protein ASC67_13135 [Methylibium sp. Root1272]